MMEGKFFNDIIPLETRAEAHETVDKQKRYRQIKEILAGSDGMTAKEIAVAMMRRGYVPTTERNWSAPRLTEMLKTGVVDIIGKKKCQYTGKKVSVYVLWKGGADAESR